MATARTSQLCGNLHSDETAPVSYYRNGMCDTSTFWYKTSKFTQYLKKTMSVKITYEDIVRAWRDKNIKTVEDLEIVLSDFKVIFAYCSNEIEGAGVSFHQTREIFENGKVVGYTGDIRALFEAQNQKECYEYLKERIVAKEPLSSDMIKAIHEKLTHGCYDEVRWAKGERPGEYKKNYYGVGLTVGVPPEDVAEEIEFICKELAEAELETVEDVIKAAVWFHCSFERIHAFADGNGRVGRTLLCAVR